jgi:hypothetical protein
MDRYYCSDVRVIVEKPVFHMLRHRLKDKSASAHYFDLYEGADGRVTLEGLEDADPQKLPRVFLEMYGVAIHKNGLEYQEFYGPSPFRIYFDGTVIEKVWPPYQPNPDSLPVPLF